MPRQSQEEAPLGKEIELSRREAELEHREAALLRDVEKHARTLGRALAAVEAQRERLDAVRAEYEARREALAARAREVDALREHLRSEEARLRGASIELEDRARGGSEAGRAPAPAPTARRTPIEPA
ncbi:MAG: hypothetical protein ACYDCH_08645 [Gaiellaceae bacterium]